MSYAETKRKYPFRVFQCDVRGTVIEWTAELLARSVVTEILEDESQRFRYTVCNFFSLDSFPTSVTLKALVDFNCDQVWFPKRGGHITPVATLPSKVPWSTFHYFNSR